MDGGCQIVTASTQWRQTSYGVVLKATGFITTLLQHFDAVATGSNNPRRQACQVKKNGWSWYIGNINYT